MTFWPPTEEPVQGTGLALDEGSNGERHMKGGLFQPPVLSIYTKHGHEHSNSIASNFRKRIFMHILSWTEEEREANEIK